MSLAECMYLQNVNNNSEKLLRYISNCIENHALL